MDKKSETLGRRIARLRLTKGMTQERLAGELGVTAQAVSKWENDLSAPDIALLPALSRTLGVTVDELLGARAEQAALTSPAHPKPAVLPNSGAGTEGAEKGEPKAAGRPRTLHINVHDADDGDRVNLNLPLSVAGLAMRAGGKIAGLNLNGVDMDLGLLADALKGGEKGTLIEVDGKDGDHVTISLE